MDEAAYQVDEAAYQVFEDGFYLKTRGELSKSTLNRGWKCVTGLVYPFTQKGRGYPHF